ncbi:cytochrome P450 4V2 [Ixodes scapularis]|uniref:cytochrome P450 4V2 n=1 Tax=Ixodes scapularis TaxID=6945 RepID=UPI001A9D5CFD|nr:cytochrome P450 4V2 [Ixodes scapularis]
MFSESSPLQYFCILQVECHSFILMLGQKRKNRTFGQIADASEIYGNNTFKMYIGMTPVVISQTPDAAEGSDATLSVVTWSIYMLGLHPKTQAKVHRELDAIFGTDTNRCVTADDLKRMKYLECCLKETIRLYPPVPIVGRVLEHDQVIDNQTVPKGVQFFINVFRLHRNPKYFSDPERYLPERFMREETTFRPPFVYIPFSGGARKCLGLDIAHEQVVRFSLGVFVVIRKLASQYPGQTSKVYVGMTPVVVIDTPGAVETLLTSSVNHRKPFIYDFINSWLGQQNILVA